MSSSPIVIKFFPASTAIGFIFGRRGANLRQIGSELNRGGDKVTIKFNDPTSSTPGQFCIISGDGNKAQTAYQELRKLEEECVNGRIVHHSDGGTTREHDWWSQALSKDEDEKTIKFSHEVIKSLAGLVLGKKSINLEQARADNYDVDIQVANEEKSCVITYEVAKEKEMDAFKALQQLRRIEREAFAKNQTMCLNSQTRAKKTKLSDGLVEDEVVVTLPTLATAE